MSKLHYNRDLAIKAMELSIHHMERKDPSFNDIMSLSEAIYKFICGEDEVFDQEHLKDILDRNMELIEQLRKSCEEITNTEVLKVMVKDDIILSDDQKSRINKVILEIGQELISDGKV